MEKQRLVELLAQYDKRKGWAKKSGIKPDREPIKWLRMYLITPEIEQLDPNKQVSYKAFKEFITRQTHQSADNMLTDAYLNTGSASAELFKNFKTAKSLEQRVLETESIGNCIASFVCTENIGTFFRLSRNVHNSEGFNQQWWDRLLAEGVPSSVLDDVKERKCINNYKILYRSVRKMSLVKAHLKLFPSLTVPTQVKRIFAIFEPWSLLAMSGEPKALKAAEEMRFYVAAPNLMVRSFANLASFAALSGVRAQLNSVYRSRSRRDIHTDAAGCLIAHYAALSGDSAILKLVHSIWQVDFAQRDVLGRTSAHYAALSGEPEQLKLVCELTSLKTQQNVDVTQVDALHCSVAHYAALSGKSDQLRLVCELKNLRTRQSVDIVRRDIIGQTIGHYAALSGNYETLKLANELLWNYEVKGIKRVSRGIKKVGRGMVAKSIKQVARTGRTIGHCAALSGDPATLRLAYEFLGKEEIKEAATSDGRTIGHYAALSGDSATLRLACQLLGREGIKQVASDGRTIGHCAALSGDLATLRLACELLGEEGIKQVGNAGQTIEDDAKSSDDPAMLRLANDLLRGYKPASSDDPTISIYSSLRT